MLKILIIVWSIISEFISFLWKLEVLIDKKILGFLFICDRETCYIIVLSCRVDLVYTCKKG